MDWSRQYHLVLSGSLPYFIILLIKFAKAAWPKHILFRDIDTAILPNLLQSVLATPRAYMAVCKPTLLLTVFPTVSFHCKHY